jgi:Tol biopolymer transport system component
MARLVLILTTLAMLVAASPAAATYPGRNGGIAYANGGTGSDREPLMRSAGIEFVRGPSASPRDLVRCQLTDDVPSGGDCTATQFYSPSFSPNGKLIAFDAGARIGLIAASGGAVTLLPGATANDGDPTFTADGKRIVFTGANDHGTTDLYVRSVNGAAAARLLLQDAGEPAVSVRGVLAYVRTGNVYLRLPKHGKRRFVTSGVSPDWSPDGHRLVIVRPLPRLTFDVPLGRMFAVRPNGRGLTRVGPETDALHPVWSPNGRWIAYDRSEAGIFARRVGSHNEAPAWAETQFGDEGASNVSFNPAWRPL